MKGKMHGNSTKGVGQFKGGDNKPSQKVKGNSTKGAEAFRGQRGTK